MKLQRKNRRALALGALAVSGALALTRAARTTPAVAPAATAATAPPALAPATSTAPTPRASSRPPAPPAQKNAIDAWVKNYAAACKDVQINQRRPDGSGAGITAFLQGQTAFAGSDSALKPEEIEDSKKIYRRPGHRPADPPLGCPIAIGYNVPGVSTANSLHGARLQWFPWAVAAASVALGLGISTVAGLDSSIQWALDRLPPLHRRLLRRRRGGRGQAPGRRTAPRPAWSGSPS
ncbi:hypothetical protein SHIRM173S_10924 [Streptomyces hirsutus]